MSELLKNPNQLKTLKLFPLESIGRNENVLAEGTIREKNLFANTFYTYLDKKQIDSRNPVEFMQAGITYLKNSQKKHKVRTIRKEKQFLKDLILLNFPSANTGKLDTEFKKLKLPTVNESKTKVLSREEIQKILEELEPETYRLFVRFLFNTGFRVSEMLSIRLIDCQEDGANVTLSVIGKGNKSDDSQSIDLELFQEIKKAFNSETFLFENHKSKNRKFTRQYLNKIMNKAGKLINRKVNPHLFRHSIATVLIESGESIKGVQKFLRHADVTTTAKFYLHDTVKKETLKKVRV